MVLPHAVLRFQVRWASGVWPFWSLHCHRQVNWFAAPGSSMLWVMVHWIYPQVPFPRLILIYGVFCYYTINVSRRETEHDMGLFESKKTHSSHSSAHGPSDRSGKYTLHIQSPLSLYTQYHIYHAYLHPAIRLSHGPPQELNLPRHISKPETSP